VCVCVYVCPLCDKAPYRIWMMAGRQGRFCLQFDKLSGIIFTTFLLFISLCYFDMPVAWKYAIKISMLSQCVNQWILLFYILPLFLAFFIFSTSISPSWLSAHWFSHLTFSLSFDYFAFLQRAATVDGVDKNIRKK